MNFFLSPYIALSNWIWKIYHIDIILRPKLCQFVQFEISPSMSHKVFIFWKITHLYIVFFCPVCASVMRGRTVYRETGRKETRGGRKEKRGEKKEGREKGEARWEKWEKELEKEKRGGRMDKPVHPLCYGTAFLRPTPSFQHRSSKSCI